MSQIICIAEYHSGYFSYSFQQVYSFIITTVAIFGKSFGENSYFRSFALIITVGMRHELDRTTQ